MKDRLFPSFRPSRWVGGVAALLAIGAAAADFAPEPMNVNLSLPDTYPEHWLVVHDAAFFHMREGRYLFVDPHADTVGGQVRGLLSADFIAHYEQSAARGEHYVIESFFARGGRGGERTDVVTIYDAASLAVSGEVIIPPRKLSSMPERLATGLVAEDKLLVVYNFTPGQSLTVVDLEKREFVAEHGIAGCSLAIPTGDSGVTSLCGDGAFLTTTLSNGGASAASVRSEAVFADESDPMFEKAGITGGVAYFPTFKGDVLPVDVSGDAAMPGERWPLASVEEKAAGWRPGGWQLVAADHLGRLYVLMNPNGADGSHKDGGGEVWVFDAAAKKRIMRIPLPKWGISVGVSNAEQPLLVVTNGELGLETYSTATGEMVKTLAVSTQTPFIVRGVQ